ncbi:MAG: lysophospholipid acyltransferase family protein [Dolichospermum sp.]
MIKSYFASTVNHSVITNKNVNPLVAQSTSEVSPWLTTLAYFLGRYVVLPFFFGDITITGQENIPTDGPVIFAPSHRSRWDSLLLPYGVGRHVTGRDMRFMVTSNECQGLQGWLVLRMGGFPVNIQQPAIATLRHTVELMYRGEILVIYPEGGIYRDGQLHPLKQGIARLSLTAESNHPGLGIKIIPIAIQYSQSYPTWGTNVNIHIGEPIQVVTYMNSTLKQEAKRLTADLAQKLKQLTHRESAVSDRIFAEIHH